jgi:hypothetical protein
VVKFLNTTDQSPPSHKRQTQTASQYPGRQFLVPDLLRGGERVGLADGQPFPSLGSRDKPAQNADGSTDLYLGPAAPEGKQVNWLRAVPSKGYFAILRLCGPTKAAIDKS